jgi:hypothetical protein
MATTVRFSFRAIKGLKLLGMKHATVRIDDMHLPSVFAIRAQLFDLGVHPHKQEFGRP